MASNPIRQLIKDIQYKTDLSLDQIADRVGVSRAYFRNEVSKGTSQSILNKLQSNFNDIIEQNVPRGTLLQEPVIQYGNGTGADLRDEIIALQKKIISQQEAEKGLLQSQIAELREKVESIDKTVRESSGHLQRIIAAGGALFSGPSVQKPQKLAKQ
jgi:AraC-like DNA-binding protein